MPIINRGDDYFQAGTYTGNGSTLTITGLRFQPDFVWIKGRSGATDHALYDAVRGVQKRLESNTTDAEVTSDGGVTAFTSDGFTVGSLAQVNTNGATYVYWAWKANGAGSSNTAGSITSTVSANTTSGFSIVTYVGTNAIGATVGHGLGVAPQMIIIKNRSSAEAWPVYHTSIGATKYLVLNTTAASATATTPWNNTAPTSTVFTIANWNALNENGSNHVAYCFAPVAGYSAFGSYTGNGSADGVFVYTGFRPRYLLIKETGNVNSWEVYDTARNEYNVQTQRLFPNDSQAEATTNPSLDILSNGFKCRAGNTGINRSGGTYIYMALAENPFKYSLAR